MLSGRFSVNRPHSCPSFCGERGVRGNGAAKLRHIGQFRQVAGQKIGAFAGHRGGNFVVLLGAVASSLVVATGFAIDTVQLVNAKQALRSAVDSAVTSTARGLTLGDTTEE